MFIFVVWLGLLIFRMDMIVAGLNVPAAGSQSFPPFPLLWAALISITAVIIKCLNLPFFSNVRARRGNLEYLLPQVDRGEIFLNLLYSAKTEWNSTKSCYTKYQSLLKSIYYSLL